MHYSDTNPVYELFVSQRVNHNDLHVDEVGLVCILYENEFSDDYFRNGRTPFALDNRNRTVFYTSSDNNGIWKGNIDDPDMNEVCSHITNLCMCIYIYIYIYIYVCMYI